MSRKLTLLSLMVIAAATPAFALSINTIETTVAPGTAGVTIGNTATSDPTAIIDYLASEPGSLDGYTYTNYAILAHDGTGSLEVFGHLPTGSSYVPTVGDAISATGTYSPFNGIPELGTLTDISASSSGNPVLAPTVTTISVLNAIAGSPNYNVSEYLLELDNVTLVASGPSAGATNFAVHGNTTLTISDGTDSFTGFQWASSYMAAGALGGLPIPTGPANITGIVDNFSGTVEFVPFTVTAVPEPASLSVLALSGMVLLGRRRK